MKCDGVVWSGVCVRIRSMWQRLIKLLKLWFSCSVGFQSDFSSFSGVQHLQISDESLHISTTVLVMQHFFVLDTFQWPVFSFLSISYSGASNKWSLLQMLTWRKFQTTIYFTPSDEILHTFLLLLQVLFLMKCRLLSWYCFITSFAPICFMTLVCWWNFL